MAVFKFVINDPSTRKTFQKEVDQNVVAGVVGKKIGNDFNGDLVGMDGYTLEITGGTDKDGFPMHPGLKGSGRKKLLLTNPPGFNPTQKGLRRRKMVRGDTISHDIVQINVKVKKAGLKAFDEFMPKKEGEKKESNLETKPEPEQENKPEATPEKAEEKKEEIKEEKAEPPVETPAEEPVEDAKVE